MALSLVILVSLPLNQGFASTLSDKQADRAKVEKNINSIKKQLEATREKINNLNDEITYLKRSISYIKLKIQDTSDKISDANKKIAAKNLEIDANRADYEHKQSDLNTSVKVLYESSTVSLLELILSAQNLSDIFSQKQYHDDLEQNIQTKMEALDEAKTKLDEAKAELEQDKKDLEKLKSDQLSQQQDLTEQQASQQALLKLNKKAKSDQEKMLEQSKAQEDKLDSEIERLLQEQYSNGGDTEPVNVGFFGSPLPWDPPQISIVGGDFMDPHYGFGFPHYGVDFRASQGTTLKASAGGTVISAHMSSTTALSYIVIDHHNGYITKYLHCSAIYVHAGQSVDKGTIIGKTGGMPGTRGAGMSTGPHLHFEIRKYINGSLQPVNPHHYLFILPPP